MGYIKMRKLFAWFMLFVAMATIVVAVQPTQSYSKIYLDPFYRSVMTAGTPYVYNVSVFPPDGVSGVKSAIVTFKVLITPTVTFNLTVNGQACSNPLFLAHTTYADAGQIEVTFDCSNVITQSGVYSLVLLPTQANTGAITGWLDLTYMNNPVGSTQIFGTEYIAGDYGRIFLQLRDNQGLPENSGSCRIDIYYPAQINSTADVFLDNAPMLYLSGSDGVYYYDVASMPMVEGVYMMTAGCNAELSSSFCYETSGTDSNSPSRNVSVGTYSSSTIALNGYDDFAYTSCSATGGASKQCIAIYDYDLKVHFDNSSMFTDLSLFYMGEASGTALLSFEVFNWSNNSWIPLSNNLTFSGLASAGVTGRNDFVSNTIPSPNDTISTNRIIRIRTTSSLGTVFSQYDNWLNINLKTTTGVVQELKGSGELHISSMYRELTAQHNTLNNSVISTNTTLHSHLDAVNISINDNVDYTREYLYNKSVVDNNSINANIDFTRLNLTAEIDSAESSINNNIFSVNSSLYSRLESLSVQINDALNNLTSQISGVLSAVLNVPLNVWSYSTRNLTYYADMTNYTLIQENQYNYSSRFDAVDSGLYGLNISIGYTPFNVWDYGNRTLTAISQSFVGGTEYSTTETTGKVVARMTDNVGEPVTGGNCTLTVFFNGSIVLNQSPMVEYVGTPEGVYALDFNLSGIAGVYPYAVDCLKSGKNYYMVSSYHIFGNTPEAMANAVWNASVRNLTYYPDVNSSVIAEQVWNSSNKYIYGIII